MTLNEGRGLDPGNTRPRGPASTRPAPLNEGRGLDPGNTPSSTRSSPRSGPLNEGRGLDPGNTSRDGETSCRSLPAQRRPGPRPRQHICLPALHRDNRKRSTKAGASTPATPRAEVGDLTSLPRCSTKAGASTPATRLRHGAGTASRQPAQRRPGPRPRQHTVAAVIVTAVVLAQRRPGPRPRQHADAPGAGEWLGLLNEGRGLDPGNTCGLLSASTGSKPAQRRPGPRPRQHTPGG